MVRLINVLFKAFNNSHLLAYNRSLQKLCYHPEIYNFVAFFFSTDCLSTDMSESTSLAKWSSLELLAEEDDSPPPASKTKSTDDSIFSHTYLQRVASERGGRRPTLGTSSSIDRNNHESPPSSPGLPSCPTSVLALVFHAGSCLDANTDRTAKKSDVTTFRGAFESVMRQHYPSLVGHVVIKLVCCPSVCTDALGILSR